MYFIFKTRLLFLGLIICFIATSCRQSDKVVSESFIGKRKYRKGVFIADFLARNKVGQKECLAPTSKSRAYLPDEGFLSQEENTSMGLVEKEATHPSENGGVLTSPAYPVISKTKEITQRRKADQPPKEKIAVLAAPEPAKHWGAIASLVMGVCSILSIVAFPLGVLLGPAAIVLGIIALVNIQKYPQKYNGKEYAIAGIVTGAVSLLITVAIVAFFIALFSAAFNQ